MSRLQQALFKVGLKILDEKGEEANEFDQTCFLLSCLNCFHDFSPSSQFSDVTKGQFLSIVLAIQSDLETSAVFSVKEKLQWRPVLHNINRAQATTFGNRSFKPLFECLQGMHAKMSDAIALSTRRVVSKFDKCGYRHQQGLQIVERKTSREDDVVVKRGDKTKNPKQHSHDQKKRMDRDNKKPNETLCSACGLGDKLLTCDYCSKSFHLNCIGMIKTPEGKLECQLCSVTSSSSSDELITLSKFADSIRRKIPKNIKHQCIGHENSSSSNRSSNCSGSRNDENVSDRLNGSKAINEIDREGESSEDLFDSDEERRIHCKVTKKKYSSHGKLKKKRDEKSVDDHKTKKKRVDAQLSPLDVTRGIVGQIFDPDIDPRAAYEAFLLCAFCCDVNDVKSHWSPASKSRVYEDIKCLEKIFDKMEFSGDKKVELRPLFHKVYTKLHSIKANKSAWSYKDMMVNIYGKYLSTFSMKEDANKFLGRSIWAELKNVKYTHQHLRPGNTLQSSPIVFNTDKGRPPLSTSTSSTQSDLLDVGFDNIVQSEFIRRRGRSASSDNNSEDKGGFFDELV